MQEFDKDHAVAALVKVNGKPDCWGMGFATVGGHIITAAHCLPSLPTLNEALFWDELGVVISDIGQSSLEATVPVVSVDPCQDVAVLALSDDHAEFVKRLKLVPLYLQEPVYDTPIQVHVYTHWGEWLSGECEILRAARAQFAITLGDTVSRDLGGTSGAPVFAENGHVLGIILNSNENGEIISCAARLATALPNWVLQAEKQAHADAE